MKKGQIMIVGALIVIVLIFVVGFSLMLLVKYGPGAAQGAAYGGGGGAVLGASAAFVSSLPTGPGVLVATPVGAIGGTVFGGGAGASFSEVRSQSIALGTNPRFSSYSFEAMQLGHTVLYSDSSDGQTHGKLIEYIYCHERENANRCPSSPEEEMEELIRDKIESYMNSQDTGSFSYNATVYKGGEDIMDFEVERERNSEEEDKNSQEGRTVVEIPISQPTGEKASIRFVFKVGNLKAVAGFEGDMDG